jgi:preprotein translocase subunit SecG
MEQTEFLDRISHSLGSILLNILFFVIIILLSFLFNMKKIRKLNAKDIFKLD